MAPPLRLLHGILASLMAFSALVCYLALRRINIDASFSSISTSAGEELVTRALLWQDADADAPADNDYDGATIGGRRFPAHGTPQYSRLCPWTDGTALPNNFSAHTGTCSVYISPSGTKNREGWGWYISESIYAYMLARVTGCAFYADYGTNANLTDVLVPVGPKGHATHDWTVPSGYRCTRLGRCMHIKRASGKKLAEVDEWAEILGVPQHRRPIPRIPPYRFSYRNSLWADWYEDIGRTLPGFDLETGMACAYHRLFRFSPQIEEHVPNLYNELLPALRDPDALIIAVYYRTNNADALYNALMSGGDTNATEVDKLKKFSFKDCHKCLMEIERTYLSKLGSDITSAEERDARMEGKAFNFSRIVWMLVSDSPRSKEWVADTYGNGIDANADIPHSDRRFLDRVIPRTVLTTGAQGKHTRNLNRNESFTHDLAEAVVDWYLVGESDVALFRGGTSFGQTAALRTARTLYQPCKRDILVKEGTLRTPEEEEKLRKGGHIQ